MKLKFKLELLCYLAVGFVLWGCAPPAPKPATNTPAFNYGAALNAVYKNSGSSYGSDANWRCPNEDNINPRKNVTFEGYAYGTIESFMACSARSGMPEYRISGSTTAQSVCVYPMYADRSNLLKLVDTPQCFSISRGEIRVTFSSREINYLVIVDADYTSAFSNCLSGTSACPPRSEGFLP